MLRATFTIAALAILLVGCAGQRAYDDGMSLIEAGRIDEGLAKIDEASRLEPSNRKYRQAYFRERDVALQRQLTAADAARQQGQWAVAEAGYRRVLAIDAENARARAGLESAKNERRQRVQLDEAEVLLKKDDVAAAQSKVREVLAENGGNRGAQLLLRRIEERSLRAAAAGPQLAMALKKPITLEFREASLRQVFELIARSTNLNFIFDRDVRPDLRTTVFVRDASVEDTMRFILVTNQLERKVLSENTVLIYPGTPAKLREYQDLVVRSFYLSNTDAKSAANLIRTLVKTKDMHIDEKLNLLVIRDTPEAVRMAERLIANQDQAEPEVILEVEVMEVSSNELLNLGIQYPDQVSYSLVGAAGIPGTITLPEWQNRDSNLVRMTVPTPFLTINLREQLGRSNLLANPRIRVKNRDKAKIHIGDKVPVITTTSTSTGFVAESVAYLDTGLKLEVEPQVFLENDVSIKVSLEVSNIVREIKSISGTLTYQVGTRNAATTLRLKDGETQVLAGLISDEERKTANQIPGLGSIPLLGRLFGTHNDTSNKTEIVLLITPRVVRNIARPELRFEEFPAGTEAAIGAMPMQLQSRQPPASAPAGAAPTRGAQAAAIKVSLQTAAAIPAGQEFTVCVGLDSEIALRGGLLDFAFDPTRLKFVRGEPGGMLVAADKEAAFRAIAPEALGRMNLSFSSKGDLKGPGDLAQLTFQVISQAAGAPAIRVEAMVFTDAGGKAAAVPLPPPLSLNLTR